MDELFQNIETISQLVDQGAWEDADRAIRDHAVKVREAFRTPQTQNEPAWRDLLARQRSLSLKFSAMHSDVADCIEDLRRSRAAARRYLSETT